jgi:hypothetical protein
MYLPIHQLSENLRFASRTTEAIISPLEGLHLKLFHSKQLFHRPLKNRGLSRIVPTLKTSKCETADSPSKKVKLFLAPKTRVLEAGMPKMSNSLNSLFARLYKKSGF